MPSRDPAPGEEPVHQWKDAFLLSISDMVLELKEVAVSQLRSVVYCDQMLRTVQVYKATEE